MALAGTLSTLPHWTNNISTIPTPCYLIDEEQLINNLVTLNHVKSSTNCKILLALKGYSTFTTFPLLRKYLDGVTASSLYEAKLGYEEFNKNIHFYSVASSLEDVKQVMTLCSTISCNSINQLRLFQSIATNHPSIGLRINPNISTVKTKLYDPCQKFSRLGVPIEQMNNSIFSEIDGIHFHALCEQNTDALEKVLSEIEQTFGDYLKHLKWMNWGGGHHITRKDYNLKHLIDLINHWKKKI